MAQPMYEFTDCEIVRVVRVRVWDYEAATPDYRRGHPDNWEQGSPESLDCEAFDEQGNAVELTREEKREVIGRIHEELERAWDAHAADLFDAENDR